MSEKATHDQLLGSTARWTAGVRARESLREDRLFNDPWAASLAGMEGQEWAGVPWIGTMDDPEAFLATRGWKATLTLAGEEEANYGRWRYPVIPRTIPDMPRSWFVTAQKQVPNS